MPSWSLTKRLPKRTALPGVLPALASQGPSAWAKHLARCAQERSGAPASRPGPASRASTETRAPGAAWAASWSREAAVLGPRPPEPAHRRSAGSRCRPCGPPAPPSLSLFHTVCSSSGRRRPGPPVSAEPCAPPCSPHLRGGLRPAALAALPPLRPLSRRGRWSRLPGVARPEPLDSGISHHAAPTRPGPAALCGRAAGAAAGALSPRRPARGGPGRGRGASPAGLREDTRVRSSWPRPGRAGSPHGREPGPQRGAPRDPLTWRPEPRPPPLPPFRGSRSGPGHAQEW